MILPLCKHGHLLRRARPATFKKLGSWKVIWSLLFFRKYCISFLLFSLFPSSLKKALPKHPVQDEGIWWSQFGAAASMVSKIQWRWCLHLFSALITSLAGCCLQLLAPPAPLRPRSGLQERAPDPELGVWRGVAQPLPCWGSADNALFPHDVFSGCCAGSGTDKLSLAGCLSHLVSCWEAEAHGRWSGVFLDWVCFYRQGLPPALMKDKAACSLLLCGFWEELGRNLQLLGSPHPPSWSSFLQEAYDWYSHPHINCK